jgi:phage shock protein PspC (stress-responsive transcriptional regulator)
MKKNISINISGIIFHIEEDGYEALRSYLDSIHKYFIAFDDSTEIIADIESRMAEIFLARLNEGKQVITLEDVQALQVTMGSVNDFKAAEAEEAETKTASDHSKQTSESNPEGKIPMPKSLSRDQRRKILGGVCAGIANYFGIDSVWPRVLTVLLTIASGGLFLVAYVILWAILPPSFDLEETSTDRKMYRNPDNKVLGGVASGLASFFGIDTNLARVLFVISVFFGGFGFLIYIILWIALPEAHTISEKIQMQGDPVTLSNIESTVKKNLNETQPEESTLTKIVLFPFRLLGTIFSALGSALGPLFTALLEGIRIFIGLVITLLGLSMVVSVLLGFGVLFGMFSWDTVSSWWWGHEVDSLSFPFESIRASFPTWTALFGFIGSLVPGVFILLIGISIIVKRIVFNPLVGWSLFVLFIVSAIFLSLSIPGIILSLEKEGEVKIEQTYSLAGTPVLRLREVGLDNYDVTDIRINSYDGNDIKIIQRFEAQGPTRLKAEENARTVDYSITQSDSVLTFDSNISFRKDTPFRFQRLRVDVLMPENRPFYLEDDLWRLIDNYWRYDFYQTTGEKVYRFEEGILKCTTCDAPEKDRNGIAEEDQFGLKDFKEIEMTGVFDVAIVQGDEYSIELEGNESLKNLYTITTSNDVLEITYRKYKKKFWEGVSADQQTVSIKITLPELEKLKATGAGRVRLRGFDQGTLDLAFTGAMSVDGRFRNLENLYLIAEGPMNIDLEGNVDMLDASITGATQLMANQLTVANARIEAKGLANAKLNVTQSIQMDKDITSTVKYTGTPEVIQRD